MQHLTIACIVDTAAMFSELANEDQTEEHQGKAEANACTDAVVAASLVLRDVAVLDQAVLSTAALRKIVAAHCDLTVDSFGILTMLPS